MINNNPQSTHVPKHSTIYVLRLPARNTPNKHSVDVSREFVPLLCMA